MSKKGGKKSKSNSSTIALNKKARYEYEFQEKFEAGLSLQGWEVKAIRQSKVNLTDSYIFIRKGEVFLVACNITPLSTVSTHFSADPLRGRKLLLHRKEIDRLVGAVDKKSLTLVPVSMYWKKAWVKVEFALAKGKKMYDKRQTEKDRDWSRDKSRIMKHYSR